MVFCHPLGPWFVNCERDNQDGRDGRDPKAEGWGLKFRTLQLSDRPACPACPAFRASLVSLARIMRCVSRVARATRAG
jgi:hypothetical protein